MIRSNADEKSVLCIANRREVLLAKYGDKKSPEIETGLQG
jgi:hypothetical protein